MTPEQGKFANGPFQAIAAPRLNVLWGSVGFRFELRGFEEPAVRTAACPELALPGKAHCGQIWSAAEGIATVPA